MNFGPSMRARADNFYSPAPLGLHEDKVFSPGAVDDPQSPRSAFADRAAWMLTVFEICAHLGCRFSEAEFGREDVDFKEKVIWLIDSKRKDGDPRKRYAVPMPAGLAQHLQQVFKKSDRTSGPLTGDQNRVFNSILKIKFHINVANYGCKFF